MRLAKSARQAMHARNPFSVSLFRGRGGLVANQDAFRAAAGQPIDLEISPQISFFSPVGHGRLAIGGSLAGFHGTLSATSSAGAATLASATKDAFVAGSIVFAVHRLWKNDGQSHASSALHASST